jgi:natural product precursor
MKKLSKLKLNSLSERELNKREMQYTRGGIDCWCWCGTGSSFMDDAYNYSYDTNPSGQCYCICWCGPQDNWQDAQNVARYTDAQNEGFPGYAR